MTPGDREGIVHGPIAMSYQRSVDEIEALSEVQPQLGSVEDGESTRDPSTGDLYRNYRAQTMFGSLDALRALSILAVVWHHASWIPEWFNELVPGATYGFLGVDLFFVLSGFLIVTLLSRERDRNGSISLKHFYVRRSLRIIPLYYGTLAAFALLFLVLRPHGSGAPYFREDLPYLLLYLTNWVGAHGMLNVTWSLSAEEQFYLCWPPIERFTRRAAVPVVLVVILLSELIQFGVFDGPLERWLGFGPREPRMLRQTTFAPICMGVLLAHALHHRPTFERLARVFARREVAPLLLATLLLGAQFLPHDISGAPRLLIQVLMTALVLSVVVREDHGLAGFCRFPPLVRIGALSYGVYLLHLPMLGVAQAGFAGLGVRPPFGDFVLGTALVLAVAQLSFRYYETPFLKLKHRFE